VFGQKLPVLFERCGLEDVRCEASTEVVRGGSPWARWWIPTLEVINELGGGGDDRGARRPDRLAAQGAAPRLLGPERRRRLVALSQIHETRDATTYALLVALPLERPH